MTTPRRHLYRFSPFELDVLGGRLFRHGQAVPLTPKAFDLLLLLIEKRGQVLDKDSLLQALWPGTFVEESTLTQQIFTIRKVLGEQPNGQPFVDTVARRGYVFVAPVEEIDEPKEGLPAAKPVRAIAMTLGASGAIALVVAVTILVLNRQPPALPAERVEPAAGQTRVVDSVAVLPLRQHARGPDDDALAEGVMELLINELSAIPTLKVTSRTSSLYYRDAKLPLKNIAESLGVNGIVEGTVLRSADRVRVTVRLVHAPTDRTVWAQTFDRHAGEMFAVQKEIARAVAHEITGSVTAPLYQTRHSADPEAFDLYLRGRYHWNQPTRAGLERAVELFTAATHKDPEYAMAYAGLANTYEASGNYAAAAEELRKSPDLSGISASEAAEIATAYARDGGEGYLRKRLDILLRKSGRDFVSPVDIAGFHARTGNADEAMRWLNRAYGERSPSLVFMQVDPALQTLRGRSDFKELVARVGLPPRV